MKVELAKSAGFCFGVNRAIDTVYQLLEDGRKVCTLGPIIHNEQVVEDLEKRGVRVLEQKDLDSQSLQVDTDYILVIRSHGVSQSIIEQLEKNGIFYKDATCPFVKKIHKTVSEYSQKGYEIVIIGNAKHPEVQGILGWASGLGHVVETKEEAENFVLGNPESKVCIVAQTTFNYKKFQDLVEIISKKGYDILAVNTICNATSTRQEEQRNWQPGQMP